MEISLANHIIGILSVNRQAAMRKEKSIQVMRKMPEAYVAVGRDVRYIIARDTQRAEATTMKTKSSRMGW